MRNKREFVAAVEDALGAIDEPRFFKTERVTRVNFSPNCARD